MGFWDPRSDDVQLQVTCVQFQEEQMVVGLQGVMVLLFHISKQSANVTIQVREWEEGGRREGGRKGRGGGKTVREAASLFAPFSLSPPLPPAPQGLYHA